MALPKLDVPTFELELPSTGKKVKYRPFLVKEHKMLLMLQDGDMESISKIITDLVDVCTFKKLNVDDLASVDIEYLFLNIRAKSINETYEFMINCECGEKYEAQADIEKLEIEKKPDHSNKILITNEIGFEMKYPPFDAVVTAYNTSSVFDLISDCVKAVYTPEAYEEITKDNKEELKEMIDGLTKQQFEKIEKFFETMPKLVQKVEGTCPKCSKVTEVEIRGLENFFA